MIRPPAAPSIVVDTNIFVAAAFRRHGDASRILAEVRAGRLRLIWNDATRRETCHVLEQIPPISWAPFAALFREEHRHRGEINPGWFGQVRDPADRVFAALAYATGATLITRDDDLLAVRSGVSISILTPSEFLARRPDRQTR